MKTSIELPNYDDNKPTFQEFLSEDNDKKELEELSSTCIKSQKVTNTREKQLNSDTKLPSVNFTCIQAARAKSTTHIGLDD